MKRGWLHEVAVSLAPLLHGFLWSPAKVGQEGLPAILHAATTKQAHHQQTQQNNPQYIPRYILIVVFMFICHYPLYDPQSRARGAHSKTLPPTISSSRVLSQADNVRCELCIGQCVSTYAIEAGINLRQIQILRAQTRPMPRVTAWGLTR